VPLSLTIGATGRHSWLLVDVLEEDLEPCWNDAEKRGAGRHASPTRSLTTNACFAWRPWPKHPSHSSTFFEVEEEEGACTAELHQGPHRMQQ
jgi:hypothetical protein